MVSTIRAGRTANLAVKEPTERAETLKAYAETDLGHREVCVEEQVLCPFEALAREVLMRALMEELFEASQQMRGRERGDLRQLRERHRSVKESASVFSGAMQSAIQLLARGRTHRRERFDFFGDIEVHLQEMLDDCTELLR